jgi:hypothetical protein
MMLGGVSCADLELTKTHKNRIIIAVPVFSGGYSIAYHPDSDILNMGVWFSSINQSFHPELVPLGLIRPECILV